jgi:hypothetical protein
VIPIMCHFSLWKMLLSGLPRSGTNSEVHPTLWNAEDVSMDELRAYRTYVRLLVFEVVRHSDFLSRWSTTNITVTPSSAWKIQMPGSVRLRFKTTWPRFTGHLRSIAAGIPRLSALVHRPGQHHPCHILILGPAVALHLLHRPGPARQIL